MKRLQGKLGFLGANLVQSLLFGLIHALMFIQLTGYLKAMAIMAFISLIAYVFGAINEKKQVALFFQVSLSTPWPIRL